MSLCIFEGCDQEAAYCVDHFEAEEDCASRWMSERDYCLEKLARLAEDLQRSRELVSRLDAEVHELQTQLDARR
jgi:hypothetical protein